MECNPSVWDWLANVDQDVWFISGTFRDDKVGGCSKEE